MYKTMKTKFLLMVTFAAMMAACGQKSAAPDVLDVTTETATTGAGDDGRNYVGEVEAATSTAVSFTGMGTVTRVYVHEGQRVSRGQVIAQMDDTQPRNTLAAGEAALHQAKDAYARMKILHEAKALSDIDWVDTESKLRQAEATVAAARKAISDCTLKAPVAGVVGKDPMESGVTALPSQPVCTLLSLGQVKVRASIPEREIGSVTAHTRATVTVAALGGRTFQGQGVERGVEADAMTRSYEVRVVVANGEGLLLPGMVAEVRLSTPADTAAAHAVTLPVRCVQLGADGRQYVWTVQGGKAHRQSVTLGETRGNRIVIATGVSEGDRVIVSGYQKVSEGSKVRVQ